MTISTKRESYLEICREERNFAAILYAILCREDNARIFLSLCGVTEPISSTDLEIYFEYAYLRDVWHTFTKNDERKKFINTSLKIKAIEEILSQTRILEINRALCSDHLSSKLIQSPGRWNLKQIKKIVSSGSDKDKDYETICKFKWAFNVKPDLVIHLGGNRAICIETKHESGEARYSDKNDENKFELGQLELQQFLMKDVLGFHDPKFVYIVTKHKEVKDTCVLTWKKVFESLGMLEKSNQKMAKDYLPFAFRLVNNISEKSQDIQNNAY
jgi:hypothetical protein